MSAPFWTSDASEARKRQARASLAALYSLRAMGASVGAPPYNGAVYGPAIGDVEPCGDCGRAVRYDHDADCWRAVGAGHDCFMVTGSGSTAPHESDERPSS